MPPRAELGDVVFSTSGRGIISIYTGAMGRTGVRPRGRPHDFILHGGDLCCYSADPGN